MKQVSFIVAGAGGRGYGYAEYAKLYPQEGVCVAVCDPNDEARNRFGDRHDIPEDRRFKDWKDLLDKPKMADAVIICTQDAMHRDPTVALSAMGYNILLEKPMAPTPEHCKEIVEAAVKNNIIFAVCHVLRYTDFNRKLKSLTDSGLIGKIHNVQLLEPVGYWHQAHSFVRGPWRNQEESSFMLLAKSCHDLDLLNFLIPGKCKKVSSFGSLSYFNKANQPKGAADRCVDCPLEIETDCPYSAIKIYLRDFGQNLNTWPVYSLTHAETREAVVEALRKGSFGRCAFACDNDVVDHQVVNMEFEGGTTAGFTMCAFNEAGGRQINIMGDRGTLQCTDGDITHFDFLTNKKTIISPSEGDELAQSGHGGGDYGLMRSYLTAVRENDQSKVSTGPDVTLDSHLIVFAAEKSRLNNTVETL
jgi:predicted dehydrogenase